MRYSLVALLCIVWAVAFADEALASRVTSTTQVVGDNIVVTYTVLAEPGDDPITDFHIIPPVTRTGDYDVEGTQPPGGCPEHWDYNGGGRGVSWRMGDGEGDAINPGQTATFQIQIPNSAANRDSISQVRWITTNNNSHTAPPYPA